MTDKEIVEGLLCHDSDITHQFFFVRCRPLFLSILRTVLPHHIEYEELVGELYAHVMENDGEKLRKFKYRSSIFQWMKVVAIRFVMHKRDELVHNSLVDSEPALVDEEMDDSPSREADRIDVHHMLALMPNQRYAAVIKRLVLDEANPAECAVEFGVTVENLYNIKKRAMASLSLIAIKYYHYGR